MRPQRAMHLRLNREEWERKRSDPLGPAPEIPEGSWPRSGGEPAGEWLQGAAPGDVFPPVEEPPAYEGEAFEQGSHSPRGFGRAGSERARGHARHRTEWGEVGRSALYGQPPSGYHAYPGGWETADIGRDRQGPKGYVRSDERIREFICERLMYYHMLDLSDVSVVVNDGHVTLEGSVPERSMKHVIEDVADDCWGVHDVDNRVRVRRPGEAAGAGGDASRPFANTDFQGENRNKNR